MLSAKILVIFLSTITILSLNNVFCQRSLRQIQCNKNTYKEVDRMIAKALPYGQSEVKFPETIEELQDRCDNRKGLMTTIEDLNTRCMKGMIKRVMSVIIYSMRRQRKSLCRKTPTKKMIEFVSAGKCINKGSKEIEKCAKASIDHILGIKFEEDNLKIPMICCEFVSLKKCLISSASKIDTCTEDNIKMLVRNSEQVSSGPMDMACGDYTEETDKCEKLKVPHKRKGQRTPKSFIVPMIEIFESFPEA